MCDVTRSDVTTKQNDVKNKIKLHGLCEQKSTESFTISL